MNEAEQDAELWSLTAEMQATQIVLAELLGCVLTRALISKDDLEMIFNHASDLAIENSYRLGSADSGHFPRVLEALERLRKSVVGPNGPQ